MARWRALLVLALAQFLMVLDTSVMNVSISQLVEDFDTEVTAIQAVITLYSLVMAAFMITGGKLGDMWGRRRTFRAGLMVYGVGSLMTALAPTLGVLTLGWSVIEGLGAALVLPALAALVAGNYSGRDRAVAYALIGGIAGAGIAVGPLLGGWVTANLTWRLVFAGEVVVVVAILLVVRWISEAPRAGAAPRLDGVGVALSALGLALVVLGVLQSSSWGWLRPRNSPIEPLGFSLTPFAIAAGLVVLAAFRSWERRREIAGRDPLVRFALFDVPALRSGLSMLLAQNLILLGLFFTIPLYLQLVQGFDAFQTGLRLLPVSVAMLLASMSGPLLGRVAGPRAVIRIGLLVLLAASLLLIGTIQPKIDDAMFAVTMALIGIGIGLLASQLGNVVQSSVEESARSEVGGLQYTAQNLGSALGTAFMGAVVIGALSAALAATVTADERISQPVKEQVGISLQAGVTLVSTNDVRVALAGTSVPPAEANALAEAYAEAQLDGLKIALLAAAGIALTSLWFTRDLPTEHLAERAPPQAARSEAVAR